MCSQGSKVQRGSIDAGGSGNVRECSRTRESEGGERTLSGRLSSNTPKSFLLIPCDVVSQSLKSPMRNACWAAGAHSRYMIPFSSRVNPYVS